MDFTWSGLHNPFGYAMLVGFLIFWKQALAQRRPPPTTGTELLALAALAGLAPLFRHDFALIIWPPLFYAVWEIRRACPRWVLVGTVILLFLPLAAWTAFSLLYFGFPLPMTAYNKLGSGLSRAVSLQNGLHYYLFTLRNDPLVLPIIFAALVWLVSRNGASRALASGATLHLFYTLYTGADYMGGRFFTYPYLLAVIVIVDQWERNHYNNPIVVRRAQKCTDTTEGTKAAGPDVSCRATGRLVAEYAHASCFCRYMDGCTATYATDVAPFLPQSGPDRELVVFPTKERHIIAEQV